MRARSIAVTALMLAALPSVCSAQSFSFGFGSGGHHHGHHGHHGHHHGHGSWFGFDVYQPVYRYPPPVVYAPPPVTYVYPAPAVQVVQPAFSQVQPLRADPSALASSPASSNSAVRLNSLPAQQQRSSVVLRNPAANAGPVAFRVQDQVDAELAAGTTRTWSDRTSLSVEFDRGGDFGTTRKVLRPGAYEFVVTEEGWDLVATVSPAVNSRAASLQKNTVPGRK